MKKFILAFSLCLPLVFAQAQTTQQSKFETCSKISTVKNEGKSADFMTECKAAEQGDARAQDNLGVMYAKGRGVPKDDQQAVFWFRKAAEQGEDIAQVNLGVMYEKGTGVPKDDQQAYFWWLLASVDGAADAIHNRDVVEKRLTPQQRMTAQAQARDWKPRVQ